MKTNKELYELSEEELKGIVGGRLTPDAQAWFNEHESVLADRLRPLGVIGGIVWMSTLNDENTTLFDLNSFKSMLSEVIDISDLN